MTEWQDDAVGNVATDAGRVDFRDLLQTDASVQLRDRLNGVLGRPYLATQLAGMLPPDVCVRLADRLEALIHEHVQREVDKIHDDIDRATAATLQRLAAAADDKRRELHRERFGRTSRLS